MAKLNKNLQKKTEESQDSFEPFAEGMYHVRLADVDTTKSAGAGPYWSWEFVVCEPGEAEGRRLWRNTSLSEKALGILKNVYSGLEAELDADTEDLIGKIAKAQVSVRPIGSGPREGQLSNQIERLFPKDEDFVPAPIAGADTREPEDVF